MLHNHSNNMALKGSDGSLPRVKPFKFTYEKEIVLYAYFKKLDYFATECVYAPDAYRGHARALVKDLEALRPTSIIDIIHAGKIPKIKITLQHLKKNLLRST